MSGIARQAGSKVAQAAKAAKADSGGKDALRKGAGRDPELYILLAIMSGAFGLAGWHFGKPSIASCIHTCHLSIHHSLAPLINAE